MPRPVVIVPVYQRLPSAFDQTSLSHLQFYLSDHEVVYIGPAELRPYWTEYEFVSFPDSYFQSRLQYNRLMLSVDLYRRFNQFSHMLIYQLDALVFKDELLFWCEQPYDYIGATFYRDLIEKADSYRWTYAKRACCNGGFSLRRVDAFLEHLTTRGSTLAAACSCVARGDFRAASLLFRYRKHLSPTRYRPHESLNEDVYFGVFSELIPPTLRTPPPNESDRFAFENIPREVLRRAAGVLPFGCHAWYKSMETLEFWRPHLIGEIPELST